MFPKAILSLMDVFTGMFGTSTEARNELTVQQSKRQELSKEDYRTVKLQPGMTVFTLASPVRAFEPSDRIATMKIMADKQVELGTMVLYLYESSKTVKRVFKIVEPQIKTLLNCKKARYYLTDLKWDASDLSLEKAKAQTCADLDRLFTGSANQNASAGKSARNKKSPGQKPIGSVQSKSVVVKSAPVQAGQVTASSATKPVVETLTSAVERTAQGIAMVGVVAEMGSVTRGEGLKAYTTFCLKLDDAGVITPSYGVELERESRERKVKAGDTIRLINMGRMPTGTGHKNLFHIEVLKRAQK